MLWRLLQPVGCTAGASVTPVTLHTLVKVMYCRIFVMQPYTYIWYKNPWCTVIMKKYKKSIPNKMFHYCIVTIISHRYVLPIELKNLASTYGQYSFMWKLHVYSDIGLSKDECAEILKAVSTSQNDAYGFTGKALLAKERENTGIVTFCQRIDSMLGDGVQTGKMTEFCGMPGTGKTQMR